MYVRFRLQTKNRGLFYSFNAFPLKNNSQVFINKQEKCACMVCKVTITMEALTQHHMPQLACDV